MAKAVHPFVVGLKNPQLTLTAFFNKKILLTIAGVFMLLCANATVYYSYTGAGSTNDATVLGNWTTDVSGATLAAPPTNFTAGDTFTITTPMISTGAWTITGSGAELDIESTYTPSSSLTLNGTFLNNGTFADNGQTVTLGTGGAIDGTSSTTFNILNIDDAGGVVPVVTSSALVTIKQNGTLNLVNGSFEVGSGNTLAFARAGTINRTGGDFANPNDGTGLFTNDPTVGGNLALNGNSGDVVTVNGSPTFYNVTTAGGDGNVHLNLQGTTTTINGTFTITGANSNLFQLNNNSPVYGPSSTLSINNHGQAYSPGAPNRLEWVPLSAGSSNINVTPGYPHNVTLMNMGASAPGGHGVGFDPTGTWTIDGTLSIGNGVTAGKVSLEDMTLFTCGGITIANNSSLRGDNIVDKGNWIRNGATIGTYTEVNNGTVTFAGSGTAGTPQAISVSSGTETSLINIDISHNTYVKLLSPVTIPDTGLVTLSAGKIETSTSHLLTLANTATNAITGGNSGSQTWVVGPLQWNLAAGSPTPTYLYPIGNASGYYPFKLNANTVAGNAVTAQAFAAPSGGFPDGTTVISQSTTEYWNLSSTIPLSGGSVGMDRPSNKSPYDMLAESLVQGGSYSSIHGSSSGPNGFINSDDIGAASNYFFLFGDDAIITPVRFIAIQATIHNSNQATVQWQVGDQQNIGSYIIDKSTDDVNFKPVGSVAVTGNSSSIINYSWNDANLGSGVTYYRVESVDQDGTKGYSQIVEVGNEAASSAATVTVYPNPVTGSTIGLLTNNVPAGTYAVILLNAGGQVVYTSTLNHVAGNTTESITPASYMQPGTYYLALTSADGTRFVSTVVVAH